MPDVAITVYGVAIDAQRFRHGRLPVNLPVLHSRAWGVRRQRGMRADQYNAGRLQRRLMTSSTTRHAYNAVTEQPSAAERLQQNTYYRAVGGVLGCSVVRWPFLLFHQNRR